VRAMALDKRATLKNQDESLRLLRFRGRIRKECTLLAQAASGQPAWRRGHQALKVDVMMENRHPFPAGYSCRPTAESLPL
jgi:hypothetical protein